MALAAPARQASALPTYREGRRIDLKPSLVSVGPIYNLEGYMVMAGGKESGLTITPEFKAEAG